MDEQDGANDGLFGPYDLCEVFGSRVAREEPCFSAGTGACLVRFLGESHLKNEDQEGNGQSNETNGVGCMRLVRGRVGALTKVTNGLDRSLTRKKTE